MQSSPRAGSSSTVGGRVTNCIYSNASMRARLRRSTSTRQCLEPAVVGELFSSDGAAGRCTGTTRSWNLSISCPMRKWSHGEALGQRSWVDHARLQIARKIVRCIGLTIRGGSHLGPRQVVRPMGSARIRVTLVAPTRPPWSPSIRHRPMSSSLCGPRYQLKPRSVYYAFIPLLNKMELELRDLELLQQFSLVRLQPRVHRVHLRFNKCRPGN
jgi:hypothetical protein